jgi:3-carboxy-cis,cis-muconate cycloisomerase
LTTFGPLFVPAGMREAVSDVAWLDAMLDVERALANALSLAGVIPAHIAAAIADKCDSSLYDIELLCDQGRAVGNPAEPLVRALREQVGGEEAKYVHHGATSQDVIDSAMMIVARNARELIDAALAGVERECAGLAQAHRSTPMAARTLLQQAMPTTFGYKAAGWLAEVSDARALLAGAELPAQLGGAAGTLAALGDDGPQVRALFASELDLSGDDGLPWHTHRQPIARLASALASVASACGKIGIDVVLLAQTEVAELAEREGGASSTMPHKQNPVRAVLARACARAVHAQTALLASGEYEHERAAGAWHSEWNALSEALAFAGGAAAAAHECLDGIRVDVVRMRANMREELLSERKASGDDDPDPMTYLGSAEAFVDTALGRYEASA